MRGGSSALEFYAAVFGATERYRFPGPGDSVAHAEIETPTYLYIYVEDVEDVVAMAVELGATLRRAPEDQFYGDRDGYFVDPFGHGWRLRRTWRTLIREQSCDS